MTQDPEMVASLLMGDSGFDYPQKGSQAPGLEVPGTTWRQPTRRDLEEKKF